MQSHDNNTASEWYSIHYQGITQKHDQLSTLNDDSIHDVLKDMGMLKK